MKAKMALLALALGTSTCLVTAQDNPPTSDNQPPPQTQGGPGGGVGARRGPAMHRGIHLLPPRAEQQLQLTENQKKQVAALEAETQAKLEKILTPEQMQKLKNMHPPMRQGGQGGQGNRGPRNGPGGDNNSMPPGPPPGDGGDDNGAPSGPPPDNN